MAATCDFPSLVFRAGGTSVFASASSISLILSQLIGRSQLQLFCFHVYLSCAHPVAALPPYQAIHTRITSAPIYHSPDSFTYQTTTTMKFLSTLLLAPLVASLSIHSSSSDDASALDAAFPVPGDQPLNFCKDPKDYILEIHHVDLIPNPPVPGQKLTIKANGTTHEEVEDGATVFLQVRYGLITLIKQEADMCEQLPK